MMDVETILERVDTDLAQAQAELRAAEGRVAELVTVREGLNIAVNRYGLAATKTMNGTAPASGPAKDDPITGYSKLSQMDACVAALTAIRRPASTREVHAHLERAGRSEQYEQVRSTLGYLKRIGKIYKVGRGLWDTQPSAAPNDFGSVSSETEPKEASESVTPYQNASLAGAPVTPQPVG